MSSENGGDPWGSFFLKAESQVGQQQLPAYVGNHGPTPGAFSESARTVPASTASPGAYLRTPAAAPAQPAVPAQPAAPVQHAAAAPVQPAAPVQHAAAAPVQPAVPVQHAAPAQPAAPVQHAARPNPSTYLREPSAPVGDGPDSPNTGERDARVHALTANLQRLKEEMFAAAGGPEGGKAYIAYRDAQEAWPKDPEVVAFRAERAQRYPNQYTGLVSNPKNKYREEFPPLIQEGPQFISSDTSIKSPSLTGEARREEAQDYSERYAKQQKQAKEIAQARKQGKEV